MLGTTQVLAPGDYCFGHLVFLIYKFIYFIYFSFWLHWVLISACGLSLVAASGSYSSLQCAGFSLWWLFLLRSTGSRCTGSSSCGPQALESRLSSMWRTDLVAPWDLPGPGLEPVFPALAGGFLTTEPPGKPWTFVCN